MFYFYFYVEGTPLYSHMEKVTSNVLGLSLARLCMQELHTMVVGQHCVCHRQQQNYHFSQNQLKSHFWNHIILSLLFFTIIFTNIYSTCPFTTLKIIYFKKLNHCISHRHHIVPAGPIGASATYSRPPSTMITSNSTPTNSITIICSTQHLSLTAGVSWLRHYGYARITFFHVKKGLSKEIAEKTTPEWGRGCHCLSQNPIQINAEWQSQKMQQKQLSSTSQHNFSYQLLKNIVIQVCCLYHSATKMHKRPI